MSAFIATYFWWIDLAIGAATLAGVVALRAGGRISRFTWRLFWVGCLLGLLWEVPLSTLDGLGIVDVFEFLSPPPASFVVIIASHTLWDGGLFLVGVALVTLSGAVGAGAGAAKRPPFSSFSGRELCVLLLWGEAQALGVELLATGTAGWTYVPARWNPAVLGFDGHHITAAPLLIWLLAPAAFYAIALRLRARG